MSLDKPEYPDEPVEPVEAETAKYNPEEIKDVENRQKTAQDIGKRKAVIGYNKETPDGRETLTKEWMKKARLSEAQIKAIDDLVGITEDDDADTRDAKRKKWQGENGLGEGKDGKGEGDGIFGWKSLEKLDAQITDKKIQELSSVGDDSPYLSGSPDQINGLNIIDQQASETAKQEAYKENQERLDKFYTEHGDTNFDVALLEEAGIDEVEYSTYKTEKQKENVVEQEEQQKKIEDGIKTKPEGDWAKVEGAEYMKLGDEVFRKTIDSNEASSATVGRDKYEVAKVGEDGKIGEFGEVSKEKVGIAQGKRENKLKEQESYSDQKERAVVMERILDKVDRGGFNEKIGDMTIGRIGDIEDNNDLTPAQRKDLQEFGKQAESLGRPDMTIREYASLVRDPLKAAQEFATDKPSKLPGGLGEYGVQYQKNNNTVFAYRKESEVPKIVTDKGEVDVQEYLKDKPEVDELFIGNGKSITSTPDASGARTYALVEKNNDKIVSTRKIKEDGSLEIPSGTPLMAATETR